MLFYTAAARPSSALPVCCINNANELTSLNNYVQVYEDKTDTLTTRSIIHANFSTLEQMRVLFSKHPVWMRITVCNNTSNPELFFLLDYTNISQISFYQLAGDSLLLLQQDGNTVLNTNRLSYHVLSFKAHLPQGHTTTYFFKVNSVHPIIFSLFAGLQTAGLRFLNLHTNIIGIYTGILIGIFLYNLFLFISLPDKPSFIYLLYIILLLLAQLSLSGYAFEYFWPLHPQINNYAVPTFSSIASLSVLLFSMYFLQSKKNTPVVHNIFIISNFIFLIAAICPFLNLNEISYLILDYLPALNVLLSIITSFYIGFKKKYRPAFFYFVAYITFSLGVIVLTLRNIGMLPHNFLTSYSLYIGTAFQITLLSFALVDQINIFKHEKEILQAKNLKITQENAHLLQEKNLGLEEEVVKRTTALRQRNNNLNRTIQNLKEAQLQLVEAEKMASLGQLTAGIAHEINNPINFIKSNLKPLELDLKDLWYFIEQFETVYKNSSNPETIAKIEALKKEIDLPFIQSELKTLIKGMTEGAERTVEIVKSLRIFSRLDETALKKVNIHEGIESTILLLKHNIPPHVIIEKHFMAKGMVECYPGKLNQVFMNILNNALYAILEKKEAQQLEYITILTKDIEENKIYISIQDTGIGMSEEVKQRIFEPFFTTKPIGEGTGLGMSIVFSIIEQLHGNIHIQSEPGKGAEFILILPYQQS